MAVLPNLTQTDYTAERFAALEAELAALKVKKVRPLTFKVGNAGGVSVYGLQRFPVTLYGSQWERLIESVPTLQKFLEDHKSQLATKD